MTQKLTLKPSGTVNGNLAVFDTTTGQVKDSGVPQPTPGGGKILQAVQIQKTDTASVATTTWSNITGLAGAITPSSATSKILIIAHTSISTSSSGGSSFMRLLRNSTPIFLGAAAGSRIQASSGGFNPFGNIDIMCGNLKYLDSPATTLAVTYFVQWRSSVTMYLNRSRSDTDSTSYARSASNLLLIEVAG